MGGGYGGWVKWAVKTWGSVGLDGAVMVVVVGGRVCKWWCGREDGVGQHHMLSTAPIALSQEGPGCPPCSLLLALSDLNTPSPCPPTIHTYPRVN